MLSRQITLLELLKAAIFIVLPVILLILYLKDQHEVGDRFSVNAKSESLVEQKTTFQPIGKLLLNQGEGVQPAYVLAPTDGNSQVSLLDQAGEIINQWSVDAARARLLKDCSLLVVHGTKTGMHDDRWKPLIPVIRRYDWNGLVIWEQDTKVKVHHDIRETPDGNYLFLVKENLNANFFRPYRNISEDIKKIRSDNIRIINSVGDLIWEWKAHEHLDLASCGRMKCSEVHNQTGWTHANTVYELPENKWYDGGDQRFKPGNIMLMLRNWWQALIIDRETKQVVWEYEGDYRGGLSGGHEAHMIEKGLPGAGNILIFDNGRFNHKDESIILEINPVTAELVWKYEDGKRFFSHAAGLVQRLPNGNTFISQDVGKRIFEVTPSGEIVWEFQSDWRVSRSEKYLPGHCPRLN